jgi:phosphoglycolate phosphatase
VNLDILIDLDGTLIDPKPGILGSIQFALAQLGVAVPPIEELAWAIGPPLRTTFPKLLGGPERTEEAVTFYRQNYANGAMYDALVYDGVPAALDALREAGCRLFIATAKPHHFARPILDRFDLTRRFAAIYGPELDGTRDQKAELIAHIIAGEGVRPETAVMIGDRAFDVTAAARNGIPTVGVTWGYGSVEELESAGAATLCRSPASLAATVRSLASRTGT